VVDLVVVEVFVFEDRVRVVVFGGEFSLPLVSLFLLLFLRASL